MPMQVPAPQPLQDALQSVLPMAQLVLTPLPALPINLWLINGTFANTPLAQETVALLWQNTPYWIFCWASGLAMARYILANPKVVAGKIVLDFGAGSGVVAIAAALAGAKQVIACDIDPVALAACCANAEANGVQLNYLDDLYRLDASGEKVDLLLAADVLYDQANRFFLDVFNRLAAEVLVADSRVRNFAHPNYTQLASVAATTWPDLDESAEFNSVHMYQSAG